MLNFLKSLFMPPPPSGVLAKERLRLVLLSDHLSLAPDVVENLKRDLLEVISRYVEIDSENADVTFEHREREVAMLASIPITGVRERGTPEASRLEARPSSNDVDAGDDVQTSAVPETLQVLDAAEEGDESELAAAGAENHAPSVVSNSGATEAAEAPPASASGDDTPLEEGLGDGDAVPARAPAIEAASPSSVLAAQQRPAQRRRRRKKRAPIVGQSLGTPAQA